MPMKKAFRMLDRALALFEDWSLFLSVMLALGVALINVVLRKTTDHSLYWSDEVVRKVIFFTTFIGCSAAIRSRSLIRIDALPQIFPVLKKGLTLLSHLAVLGFCFVMIKVGWSMTETVYHDQYARTATLQLPEWIFYAVLPLTGATMLLRTLMVMAQDWRGEEER